MKKRLTCMLLTLMLIISLLPMGAIQSNAASSWNYSENVVNLIKQFEGFSAAAYWDVSQWTIGYGTTAYAGQTITEPEADLVLRDKLNTINTAINQFAASRNLYLNQYQHDALVSFSFNCGTQWMTQGGRFYDAVVKNAGVNEFLFAISLWANAGSSPDAVLLNRRMSEANLYLNGVYSKAAPAAYTYTIFDPNGGTPGMGGEDKMQGYLAGSNVNILVANPTKAGATFGGWFTAPTGGVGVKYLSANTAARTVYAQYGTPVSVTSTYANVRNGAGTNYTQIGTVSGGAQLVIVETAQVGNSAWGRFIDGWVCLEYTNFVQGGNPTTNPNVPGLGSNPGTAINAGTVVCNTSVNVRAGAGTQHQMVGTAYNGQRVSIYEIVNVGGTNWGRIGDNRWICLTYVKLDASINNVGGTNGTGNGIIWDNGNSNTSGNTNYTLGTVTATGLNVRGGAGVNFPIVGSLKQGAQVKVYQQQVVNNAPWGRVDQGWVCLNYVSLQFNNNVNPGTPTTPNGNAIATGVVSSNTQLNVRSGAGTNAPRVNSLNPGTAVSIYEKVSVNGMEWGRIGTNQWVCLAYVKLNAAVTPNVPNVPNVPTTPAGTGTGTVISTTELNVRSGAGANFARVGTLPSGSLVNIQEVVTVGNQQWGRIGTNQWVCMTYIRMNNATVNPGTNNNTIPTTGRTGTVISSTPLNVRAAAGTNNAIVAKLNPGSTVTIYQLTAVGNVAWGRTANGWVCMNYVQLAGGNVNWQ